MRGISRRRLTRLATLFLGVSALAGPSAFAADYTWSGTSASYDSAGNWTPNTIPGSTSSSNTDNAIFPASPTVSAITKSGFSHTDIGSWTFENGATGYSFTVSGGGMHFDGAGIIDNYSNAPQLTLTNALINLKFNNSASAGDAVITEQGGGEAGFHNTSTAANATLIAKNSPSVIRFYDSSTAANATVELSNGGRLEFFDTSTGGSAAVTTDNNANTYVSFLDTSGPGGLHKVSIGSIAGGGSIWLGSNAVTIGSLNTSTTITGIISDNCGDAGECTLVTGGSLIKTGTGDLTLTGANTYTGGTEISQGTITVGNNSALGTGSLTMDEGTTLGFTGGNFTITNPITVSGDPFFSPAAGTTQTIASVISDGGTPGTVEMTGAGTLVFTAANTYTGGTTVASGTLQLGTGGSLASSGALTVNGGTFDLNGHTQTVGALSGTGGAIMLGSGALTTNSSANTTLASTISGTGTLTKDGSGTLILTGDSTYTGGTTISAGTLQIGNGGTTGSVSGDIIDNAALIFDRSDSVSFTGTISGTGMLTKEGGDTLTLSGANTYSGGTTLSDGTIEVGNDSALGTGTLSMAAGTTLSFGGDYTVANAIEITGDPYFAPGSGDTDTISGVISDGSSAGTLEMNGAGTLILTGSNTYTGGTTISAGTLQLGNGGTSGSVTGDITDNGTLAFDRSDTVTYSNVVSGTGSLVQAGSGTLIATNTNTYTGGTTISAGTLQIGNGGTTGWIAGDVTDNGGLVFDRSDTVTYAGVLSGTGTLTQAGSGTLILTGTSPLSGATTVAAGTLSVNGSLASSPVTVLSGAILGGTGTVGATTVQAGGTLAPGNSIGTIHVHGNLDLAANSIYLVQVSPSVADKTLVSGKTVIAGKLLADFQPGTYTPGTRYTLINSIDTLSGTFSNVATQNVPTGLIAQVSYDAHNAYLTLLQGLDPKTGQIYASQRAAFLEDERLIRDAVLGRLSAPGDSTAVWGEAFAAYGQITGDGTAADLDHNHAGGIVGIDVPLGDGFRVGFAGAYTAYKISIAQYTSSATGQSGHVVAYAGWNDDSFALRGGAEFGWGNSDVTRLVPLVSETDHSKQSGRTAQIFGDAGYRLHSDGGIFEPHADIVWVHASNGAFHETGGVLSSLSGPGESASATFGILGIRAILNPIAIGSVHVAPRFDLGWQHAFVLPHIRQPVSFNDAVQAPAVVVGVPIDREAATAQVGADIAVTDHLHVRIGYDGVVSRRSWDHAVIARVSWRF